MPMTDRYEVIAERPLVDMLTERNIAPNKWAARALIAAKRVTVNHEDVDDRRVVVPGDVVRVYV